MMRAWHLIALPLVGAFWLAAHWVASDFSSLVRLELVLRGHPFATVSPARSGSAFLPNMVVTSLVYEKAENIGCVDMIGELILKGDGGRAKLDPLWISMLAGAVEVGAALIASVLIFRLVLLLLGRGLARGRGFPIKGRMRERTERDMSGY